MFPYRAQLPRRKQGLRSLNALTPSDSTFVCVFSTVSGYRFGPENPFVRKSQV